MSRISQPLVRAIPYPEIAFGKSPQNIGGGLPLGTGEIGKDLRSRTP
jgi:hypothetical protein